MFLFRKKRRPILSRQKTDLLVNAIREAEQQTSGEIRVYMENHCKYVDALERARQVFDALEMERTQLRNAVLFYIAVKDRQIAIFADTGIHQAMNKTYWQEILDELISTIRGQDLAAGLSRAISEIGIALHAHFPYVETTDKNELPDDIVFGD